MDKTGEVLVITIYRKDGGYTATCGGFGACADSMDNALVLLAITMASNKFTYWLPIRVVGGGDGSNGNFTAYSGFGVGQMRAHGATGDLAVKALTALLPGIPKPAENGTDYSFMPTPTTPDNPVSHPAHYQSLTSMEAIDVIEAFELGFNLGNTVKYLLRAGRKGPRREDLLKALWYLLNELGIPRTRIQAWLKDLEIREEPRGGTMPRHNRKENHGKMERPKG